MSASRGMPAWTNIRSSKNSMFGSSSNICMYSSNTSPGHVADQRVDRLGGLHAAVDAAAVLDVVLVVAAQQEHVLGRREVQLHHRAQHAVVAEHAAIDVVAEQHQLGLGLAGVELPGLELGEEVGLEQRALEARVAAVQVAEHGELVDLVGLGRVHVDVPVEERRRRRRSRRRRACRRACRRRPCAAASSCCDEPVHQRRGRRRPAARIRSGSAE